jgi:hypothetical protein
MGGATDLSFSPKKLQVIGDDVLSHVLDLPTIRVIGYV